MNILSIAANSYQTLRHRILALDHDVDEQTLADTLEGLTDLTRSSQRLFGRLSLMRLWRAA